MTELPLSGQTALVTGGARRIGAAIVRSLHAAGAKVVIQYHQSHAEALALARASYVTGVILPVDGGRLLVK